MTTTFVTADRLALAREFLQQWHQLDRKQGTVIDWLMLKFSCTKRQAIALHDALTGTTPKRGYSRAFTPRGDTGKKYLLDDIPAGLYRDVRAKSKRTGVSIRAKLLAHLTAWVAEPD